jgi:hypothetical protein
MCRKLELNPSRLAGFFPSYQVETMEIVYHIIGIVAILSLIGLIWLLMKLVGSVIRFFDNVDIANREVTTVKDGKCASCGTPFQGSSGFCNHCGRRFK